MSVYCMYRKTWISYMNLSLNKKSFFCDFLLLFSSFLFNTFIMFSAIFHFVRGEVWLLTLETQPL